MNLFSKNRKSKRSTGRNDHTANSPTTPTENLTSRFSVRGFKNTSAKFPTTTEGLPTPAYSPSASQGTSPFARMANQSSRNASLNGSHSNNPFTIIGAAPPMPTRRPRDDPPPAYSPPANPAILNPTTTTTPASPPHTVAAKDDRYAFLSHFDTLFVIDDSGSMAGRSWRETSHALRAIAPICTAHDADGIDIAFLNHIPADPAAYKNITTATDVERIFASVKPGGGTPTGVRLNQILRPYLARYTADPEHTKPLNIIVITDGVPSDDVESVLIAAAKKLDKAEAPAWQVGVQFFQVGYEKGAAEALKELDDGLAEMGGGVRDMVDTVPWVGGAGTVLSADAILKVVLGAVNRRLDRRRGSQEMRRLIEVEG
jgi:uncharacterized protein YegL